MKAFFRNALYSGIEHLLNPEERLKLLFINSIIFFGAAVLVTFGSRDLIAGDGLLGGMTLGVAAVLLGLYGTIWVTQSYRVGVWFIPFLMFGFFTYLTASGGVGSTVLLWIVTFPVIVVFLSGALRGAVLSGLFLGTQSLLLFVPGMSPSGAIDGEWKLRLIGAFCILFTFSIAFENLRKRAQQELSEVADKLAATKVETDGILTNVVEGIFLLEPDLTIGPHHSLSLVQLLHHPAPGGQSFPRLLQGRVEPSVVRAVEEYLPLFFLPEPPWHLMDEMNPLSEATFEVDGQAQRLTFAFNHVELSTGNRILGTVRDITEAWDLSRKLKQEEDRAANQRNHLFQMIHVNPELMAQFLEDTQSELHSVRVLLDDPKVEERTVRDALVHGVHAVKGNAALVGLTAFAETLHRVESEIPEVSVGEPIPAHRLVLRDLFRVVQGELEEIRGLLGQMAQFQQGLEASSEGKDLIVLALEKAIRRLSAETEVEAHLDAADFDPLLVPAIHRKLVRDAVIQFVRNSFSHGFEASAERLARQKPTWGTIRIATRNEGGRFVLEYADDGRGFDVPRLQNRARTLSGWATHAGMADDEILDVAFVQGVSTAESPDLSSGRGVGLGLVKERVQAVGGTVKVRSTPGSGVAFDIALPLT